MRSAYVIAIGLILSSCISSPPSEDDVQTCSDCPSDAGALPDVGTDASVSADVGRMTDMATRDVRDDDDLGSNRDLGAQDLGSTDGGDRWDTGGQQRYRKLITIDHEQVDGTLNDFPVLLQTVDSDLKDLAGDPGQIRFTTLDRTPISHEIERFVPSEGRLSAWVKIPEVSGSSDTSFYMIILETADPNAENPAELWSSYAAVWHLSEDDPSNGNTIFDSTANGNHGKAVNLAQSARVPFGVAASAVEFDGADDRIEVSDEATLRPGQTYVSAWVRLPQLTDNANVVSKPARSITQNNNDSWQIYFDTSMVMRSVSSHAGSVVGHSSNNINTGAWTYVGFAYDGNNISHYINGLRVAVWSQSGSLDYDGDPILIGAEQDASNFIAHLRGAIDEVRISSQPRGAGWVSTEFANQSNPETFVTWGALEAF